MNTTGVAKHYDALGPWERVPLIWAASSRGDDVERERLARAAPTRTFRVPDYYGLSDGLRSLAAAHLLLCLDLAARFWKAEAALAEARPLRREGARGRLEKARRLLAYKLVQRVAAWRAYCAELPIDGDRLLRALPSYDTVCRAAAEAAPAAFTDAAALAFSQELAGPEAHLETLAEVVADLRAYVAGRLAEWS